jgi:ABC-type antimicrobial peptide transport system permease subunit
VEVEDPTKIEFMKTFVEQELIRYLRITDTSNLPFQVTTLSEVLSTVETVTGTLTMFLAGIAAISLIV